MNGRPSSGLTLHSGMRTYSTGAGRDRALCQPPLFRAGYFPDLMIGVCMYVKYSSSFDLFAFCFFSDLCDNELMRVFLLLRDALMDC